MEYLDESLLLGLIVWCELPADEDAAAFPVRLVDLGTIGAQAT